MARVWKMFNAMSDVTLADGSVQTQNIGDSMATGIEGEVQKKWENGGSFRAYATYTWANDNGQLPTLSPKWIIGTAVAFPVINSNNFVSIAPQVVGPMQSDLGVIHKSHLHHQCRVHLPGHHQGLDFAGRRIQSVRRRRTAPTRRRLQPGAAQHALSGDDERTQHQPQILARTRSSP